MSSFTLFSSVTGMPDHNVSTTALIFFSVALQGLTKLGGNEKYATKTKAIIKNTVSVTHCSIIPLDGVALVGSFSMQS